MITYTKVGKKGNLGNQLFQIASTIGLSVANNQKFAFLDWKYQEYFKNRLPLLTSDFSSYINVQEKEYNYHQWNLEAENYDLSGWLQTEKYFETELTKYYFEFSDSLIDQIKKKYAIAFDKRTILLSIRRGDFVNHPDYFQLPINYFLNSLVIFFPDWKSCNLIILSDDINYCKFHFSFLKNAFFGEGLNEVEQLCLGTLCDDFIVSNSTFSWWTAWLGEKKDSKIIRPFKNFDGLKSQELNDKDYFPERWIKYNHTEDRIKLNDVVFCIKTKKNREEIKTYILNYFDADIKFSEEGITSSHCLYIIDKDYFLPPLLIYSSYIKLKIEGKNIVVNSLIKPFKVSKSLDYNDFAMQKDFGLFASVFSFSVVNKKVNVYNDDIYLKKDTYSLSKLKESQSDEFVIYFYGGKFCAIGGYKYSLKKLIRRKKIKLKKSIKKILFIK